MGAKLKKRVMKITAVLLLPVFCAVLLAGCGDRASETFGTTAEPVSTTEAYIEPRSTLEFPAKRNHYGMDLVLDTDNNTVGGHIIFDFYNDSADEWQSLCFRDYPSLYTEAQSVGYDENLELSKTELDGRLTEITNIKDGRNGGTLEYKRDTDASVIWLDLTSPLAPGENMTLEYDFSAKIPDVSDRFGFTGGVYNVTNFYPILAEYENGEWSHTAFIGVGECFYSEIADYDVRLTVPAGVTVAATGTETEKCDNGETVTYTYYAPCVRDFVFAASCDFVCESKVFDKVTVNVFYRENNEAKDITPSIESAFFAAQNSLSVFGEILGVYPYDELDIVISPYLGGGMEYPNLVLISESYCVEKGVFADGASEPAFESDTVSLELTTAHEIGHQWFMSIVGSNSGEHPWQDESLASYLELVYRDNVHGGVYENMGTNVLPRPCKDLTDAESISELKAEKLLPIDRSYYDYDSASQYQESVYNVGQRVFDRMEDIIGRETMYEVLREYVYNNAFMNAAPSSFFDVLYSCAGTNNEELNTLLGVAFGENAQT